MSTTGTDARGPSRGVVVAALAVAVGALPTLVGFNLTHIPTAALYGAGWPAFGVAAALLVDRGRDPRVGTVLVTLALVPTVLMLAVALALHEGGSSLWDGLDRVWQTVYVVLVLGALVAIAAAVGHRPGRTSRRRLSWLLVWSALALGVVSVAHVGLESRPAAVVMTLTLWTIAGVVVRLMTAADLRPLDEPLVDVSAGALTLMVGASVGTLVRIAGTRADVPAPDLSAAFAAVTSTILAWPAVTWSRRSWLARRYGAGALSPADVAAITADLHHLTDPRALLGKAADMVAASSGHREVTLVLGEDAPDLPPGWEAHGLLVGGDRVGTLLLRPDDPEGPEARQTRIIEQMLPTVALVTRAVGLAIEAEHARQDVARERDAERTRILGDLHDALGPILAGMSMRVQAELRRKPTPLLQSLAQALAASRGDLRRIVAGLTPSALLDGDLADALGRLVASFDGDGRQVALEINVHREPPPDVAVAVYRCVAEGVTNALRHGQARHVAVRVDMTQTGNVSVDVHDDGAGGPIVPGVGLMSMRRRAEQLGGSLVAVPCPDEGVRLHMELPAQGAA